MVNILIEIQNDIKNRLFEIWERVFLCDHTLDFSNQGNYILIKIWSWNVTVTFSQGHWQKLTRNNISSHSEDMLLARHSFYMHFTWLLNVLIYTLYYSTLNNLREKEA